MRDIVFLFCCATAVVFSAPANQELAEIEKLLAEAKNSRVADRSSNEVTKKETRLKEVEMERQWDYQRFPVASKFLQTSTTASKKNKEKTANAEDWHWTFEHPFKSGSGKKEDPENDPWGSYGTNWKENLAEKEQMPLGASFPYYGRYPQASLRRGKEKKAEKEEWGGAYPYNIYPQAALRRGKEEVEKKAEKEQWDGSFPFRYALRRGKEEVEKKAEKEQWDGSFPFRYPQAALRRGKEEAEKKAEKAQWGDYDWPNLGGNEKKAEEKLAKEQWRSSRVHRNSSSRYNHSSHQHMKNKTLGSYLGHQMDRMNDFLKAQRKRMQDYINLTATFVRYEKNKTLEFMRQERNNSLQFLHQVRRKQKPPGAEEEEKAETEIWFGSGYDYYQQGAPPRGPPSTILREATSIHIPTSWEKDAMEVTRIQGFLRKIAPFILRKLSG